MTNRANLGLAVAACFGLSTVLHATTGGTTVLDAQVSKDLMSESSGIYDFNTAFGESHITSSKSNLSITALGAPYPLASAHVSSTDMGESMMGTVDLTYHYVVSAKDATAAAKLSSFLGTKATLIYSGSTPSSGLSTIYVPNAGVYVDSYYIDHGEIPLSQAAAIISGNLGVGHSDAGFASVYVDANSYISSISRSCSAYSGPCGSSHYSIYGQLTQDPLSALDFLGTVHMRAEVGLNGAGTAFAFVDPVISLNEDSGLGAGDYKIQLSNGFTNKSEPDTTPAVPEPASWALLISGFALAGAVLRTRRQGHVRFA